MANQRDRPKLGERYTPKYPRDYPASPSALLPLPYYANLKTVFGSVTACLVFTYLEIHHPSPRDESDRPLNTPITLHLDQISEDLQISRRTLFTALCSLQPDGRVKKKDGAQFALGACFSNLSTLAMDAGSTTPSPAPLAMFQAP